MIIRFLGTGTSTGVPELGCTCSVCTSNDFRDNRLRSSVQIHVDDVNIIIDCTPDFRQQMFFVPFEKIDGVLLTHEHYDHVGGLDDLRPFCRFGAINIYAEPNVSHALNYRMPYIFADNKYLGVPELMFHEIQYPKSLYIQSVEIQPIRVMHYKLPILGYRIGSFAYLTDLKFLPEEEFEKLKDLDILVVTSLRKKEHISHQNLSEAIQLAERVGAKRTYFTHMSHHIGLHSEVQKEIPETMYFAYDGLELKI